MKLTGIFTAIALSICLTAGAEDVNRHPGQKEVTDANNGISVISGHGDALPEKVVVRLYKWEDGVGNLFDTDTIANKQFRFEIPAEEGLTTYSLLFDYHAFPSIRHKLYLTAGATVELDAADNYMFTWPVESNVPEQTEYELFINNSKDLWKEYQKANIEYGKTENINVYQTIDSISRMIKQRDLELLKTRPVGTIWLDKAMEIAKMSPLLKIGTEELKSMYSTLDDSIKNSPEGKAIYGYLYPESHIEIGDKFPDTEFMDIDGNVHKFSEFYGKWCLVDFWNSGCAPCIQAIPELRELQKKHPGMIEIISLSIDSESIWRKASERLHLTGNNWNEGKGDYGIFRRLGTGAYPTFFVITPDGTIKDVWMGYSTGSLKRKMSFHLRPKGNLEYTESNGLRRIKFPQYKSNKTNRVLDIDGIEISNEGTKVFFSFVYNPNQWISIPPEAYLSDSDGMKYTAIGCDGIELGKHVFADSDGNGSFSITFEAIPEAAASIDFHESSSNDGWAIEGIVIKP